MWGLHPRWSQDEHFKLINARSETAAEKPSFRDAFKRGRVVLPVNGWYEWTRVRGTSRKIRHRIGRADDSLLLLGAIAEQRGGRPETFAVLTTQPRDEISWIHNRQPTILDADETAEWLDSRTPLARLRALAQRRGRYPLTAVRAEVDRAA